MSPETTNKEIIQKIDLNGLNRRLLHANAEITDEEGYTLLVSVVDDTVQVEFMDFECTDIWMVFNCHTLEILSSNVKPSIVNEHGAYYAVTGPIELRYAQMGDDAYIRIEKFVPLMDTPFLSLYQKFGDDVSSIYEILKDMDGKPIWIENIVLKLEENIYALFSIAELSDMMNALVKVTMSKQMMDNREGRKHAIYLAERIFKIFSNQEVFKDAKET